MSRFDRLVRRDTIIRDVKRSYLTISITDRFRFCPACDGRHIDTVARESGFNSPTTVEALG